MKKFLLLLPAVLILMGAGVLVSLVGTVFAADLDATDAELISRDDVLMTIYNGDASIITDVRTFEMSAGLNRVVFEDVPAGTTGAVLSGPAGTRVIRQEYRAASQTTLSQDSLLRESLEQEVTLTLRTDDGETDVTGTLLIVDGGEVLLQLDDGQLRRVFRSEIVAFRLPVEPQAPAFTPQALVLYVESEVAGPQQLLLTYLTAGLSWGVDYSLQLAADNTTVNLTGWINIFNNTQITFDDALVALSGGSIDQVQFVGRETEFAAPTATALATQDLSPQTGGGPGGSTPDVPADPDFLLDMGRQNLQLRDNRIEFLGGGDASAANVFVYDASPRVFGNTGYISSSDYGFNDQTTVQNYLEFSTTADDGLGTSLPGGRMLLLEVKPSGNTVTLGTTNLPFTAQGETVQIYLENSTDVVGERRQTEFQILSEDALQETVEIRLRNRGAEDVTVMVPERMTRSSQWELVGTNTNYEQPNAFGIEFSVTVPAGGETVISYAVLYTRPR